jgi:hypothetical protein
VYIFPKIAIFFCDGDVFSAVGLPEKVRRGRFPRIGEANASVFFLKKKQKLGRKGKAVNPFARIV